MDEARDAWELTGPATLLGDAINRVWRVGDTIVRASAARSVALVEAEQSFVRRVGRHVAVAWPRPTRDGRDWLRVGATIFTAWEVAPGRIPGPDARGRYPAGFAEAWGRHLAGLHAGARGWTGARPDWTEDRWWDLALIPTGDAPLERAVRRALTDASQAEGWCATRRACHADQGPQNLHWDGATVTSFDFDNLVFQPIGLDLAVPWSILARAHPGEQRAFDEAYVTAAGVPSVSEPERRRWLHLRRIYVLLCRHDVWATPTETQRAFLADLRERIVDGP